MHAPAPNRTTPTRLTVVDDIFWRSHHGRGTPVVMQGVWRFDDRLTPADLAAMHTAIAAGPLARRVVSPRVPLARRWFAADADVAPLLVTPGLIDPDGVVGWADDRARVPLDVDRGPAWQLALGHIRDGGSVVSLACSHLVADGLLMVGLAGDAAAGQSTPVQVAHARVLDDVADALTVLRRVIVGVLRSIGRGCVDRGVRAELVAALRDQTRGSRTTPHPTPAHVSVDWREPTVIVDVAADEWASALTRHQGSATALLVAVVAQAVSAVRGHEPVTVTVPVAVGDPGMGALGAIEVAVDADVIGGGDVRALTERIRATARAARDPSVEQPAGGSRVGPPGGMPAELLQVVGDRLAHAMIPDPGMGDGLASPLGMMPATFDGLAGHRSSGMAVRSVHPDVDGDSAALTRNTVSAWSATSADRVTISVAAPDPVVADRTVLLDAIGGALADRGLSCTPW